MTLIFFQLQLYILDWYNINTFLKLSIFPIEGSWLISSPKLMKNLTCFICLISSSGWFFVAFPLVFSWQTFMSYRKVLPEYLPHIWVNPEAISTGWASQRCLKGKVSY